MKTIGFALLATLCCSPAYAKHQLPVIDMHVHAFALDDMPPGVPMCPGDQTVLIPAVDPRADFDFSAFLTCEAPILGARNAADHRDRTLAELVKTPEIAAIVNKIETENAKTLDAFNRKYGVLDKVRALMAKQRASG